MQWRQVTTQERPWKMKRCFSRSTSRGRKGSSETGLKLGTVSTRVQARAELFGNEVVTACCQALCPTSPRVFQVSLLAVVSSSKKDSYLKGHSPRASKMAQAAARAGLLGNLTQFWGKQATVLECHRPNSQALHF